MTFTLMPDATVVMRVKSKSVTELAGMLKKKGRKSVTVVKGNSVVHLSIRR